MIHYHPLLGAFNDAPVCPREQAFQDRLDQIGKDAAIKRDKGVAYLLAMFDYEVSGIGPMPVAPPTLLPKVAAYRPEPEPVPEDFQTRTRTDERGIVWDLHRPGTSPEAGDVIGDDDGVWRPRKTISMCATRYDRAVFAHHEAQKHLEAVLAEGTNLQITAARQKVEVAHEARAKALIEADDPQVQEWDRIDANRKGDGKDEYNASRRTREKPNAKLSGMTDAEKKAHERALDAARKKRKRDAEKAKITTPDS